MIELVYYAYHKSSLINGYCLQMAVFTKIEI